MPHLAALGTLAAGRQAALCAGVGTLSRESCMAGAAKERGQGGAVGRAGRALELRLELLCVALAMPGGGELASRQHRAWRDAEQQGCSLGDTARVHPLC